MDETEEAVRELERLQSIIDRHEGHIFILRGWLITVVGAFIAAYYTENIHLNDLALRIALPVVALLFIVMELRHINIVEAVAGRASDVERGLAAARRAASADCWYDGPKVSETCKDGAERLLPRAGMTLRLYAPVYGVILAIIVLAVVFLPSRESIGASRQPALTTSVPPTSSGPR
jgi:hypothetical protein